MTGSMTSDQRNGEDCRIEPVENTKRTCLGDAPAVEHVGDVRRRERELDFPKSTAEPTSRVLPQSGRQHTSPLAL